MLPGDNTHAAAVVSVPLDTAQDRVAISFTLEVSGADLMGLDFVDQARTRIISRRGAAIVIDRLFAPEQVLSIKRVGLHPEAEVRVIGRIGSDPDGNIYGVAFLDPAANIWGIEFPPANPDEFLLKVLLECPGCHTRQIVALDEVELSVFEATENLSRRCPRCRDATLWKQSVHDVPSEPEHASPAPPAPAARPQPASFPTAPVNRRKHSRVKVELKGCILFCGQETHIRVTDMSRGGVRFISPKSFAVNLLVRAAVPYTPGAANIFVSARIRWCRPLPTRMSECGLKYVNE